jgi:hypothetical protein
MNQALDWLRADLQAWRQRLDQEPGKARPVVILHMKRCLADPDFAGVRGARGRRLPPARKSQS